MLSSPPEIYRFTLNAISVAWFAFAAVFVLRKRPPRTSQSHRDLTSLLGFFLQGCAYALVWLHFSKLPQGNPVLPWLPAELALSFLVIGLAVGSVWLVSSAVRTLGKQWAFTARLIEGHHLITNGPYRFVRNPIYTGMFGMLLATGLAFGYWIQLIPGIVLFAIGLVIRVRSEEKLLRSAFGKEFEAYAQRVPAVLPGIY
jgi:protein-S-isoprenylcysteine O-methyltransferase Ste14